MSQVHRHLSDQTYKVFSFHEFVNIAICLAPHLKLDLRLTCMNYNNMNYISLTLKLN